jgi:ABC-type polysaccharide/polyol phosphate export permease
VNVLINFRFCFVFHDCHRTLWSQKKKLNQHMIKKKNNKRESQVFLCIIKKLSSFFFAVYVFSFVFVKKIPIRDCRFALAVVLLLLLVQLSFSFVSFV